VIRASGFSPVTVAMALLGGVIAVAVAGLRGLAVYGSAVVGARILSSVLVVVLAQIEEHDRELSDPDELVVWVARGVQVMVTCASIASLDGVIRTVDGILATLIYGGCVLLGWAVRKALTPAIARLAERLAMDGRGVSEARIPEWNDAWTRALEHLERERQARPPAGRASQPR
jgi:hypothetical protein